METKADSINPAKVINFLRQENEDLRYNLTLEKLINNQYRELLANLIAKHPELEKEVAVNGSNDKQADA